MLSTLIMSAAKCIMSLSHDGRCPKQVAVNRNTPITNNNFDFEFIRFVKSVKITIKNPRFQPGSC
jgi:hypothetical protein